MQPRFATPRGVGNAEILGGRDFAMRVWIDPVRLAARGVTAGDLVQARSPNNFLAAPGKTKNEYVAYTLDMQITVLIMTSNLGTQDLRKANVGFGKADEAISYERMKEKVNDGLKVHFRPEFLNRIDEVIVFHELSKDEVTLIVDLMIKRVKGQLEGQGLGLELTQAAKVHLADRGYDPQLGRKVEYQPPARASPWGPSTLFSVTACRGNLWPSSIPS